MVDGLRFKAGVTRRFTWVKMEFFTVRVLLAGVFLYSVTLAVEKRSWHRDSRLEIISKETENEGN